MFVSEETASIAKGIITQPVLEHIDAITKAIWDNWQEFDKQLFRELRYPYGNLLITTGEAIKQPLPSLGFIEEDATRSVAFIYGGIACLQAIETEKPALAKAVRKRVSDDDMRYPTESDVRTTYIIGSEMLVAAGIAPVIFKIESEQEPFGDASNLFSHGIGWAIHRAATTDQPRESSYESACVPAYTKRS
jgi:hypothetical protein